MHRVQIEAHSICNQIMLLLSTDIDGTVFDNTESTARFAEYWSTLRDEQGYPKLAYNTGRSLDDTLALIASTQLPTPDFIISGVGTSIVHGDGNRPLTGYLNTLRNDWDFDTVWEVVTAIDGPNPQPAESQNPYKCSWFWENATPTQLDNLHRALTDRGITAQLIYSSNRDLDLLPITANKANALLHLTYHLDLPRSQVVVAGDSGNDAAMLSLDGTKSIAVANAEPALIAALRGSSFFHASKPCADGVIEGLQHFANQHPPA